MSIERRMKTYTSTDTGGRSPIIGSYRVDSLSSSQQIELERFCNGYLKKRGYKPISVSEIYEGVPTKGFQRWTILSKRMTFLERLFN